MGRNSAGLDPPGWGLLPPLQRVSGVENPLSTGSCTPSPSLSSAHPLFLFPKLLLLESSNR